jgi:hypothetical protein
MGKAGRAKKEFFDVLLTSAKQELSRSSFDAAWVASVEGTFGTYAMAEKDLGENFDSDQNAYMHAIVEAEQRIAQGADLKAWDAFVKAMRALEEGGTLPSEAQGELSSMNQRLGTVDRGVIALRDTVALVRLWTPSSVKGLRDLALGPRRGRLLPRARVSTSGACRTAMPPSKKP